MGLASFPAYMSGLGTSPLIMLTCLFVISAGITKTNLASRLAYTLLIKMGHSPRGIVTALTSPGVLVSALIANMPACLIIAAIGSAVLKEMGEVPGQTRLGKAVMLGISTGTLVGGVAFIPAAAAMPRYFYSGVGHQRGVHDLLRAVAAGGVPFCIIMTVFLVLFIKASLASAKEDRVHLPGY